MLTLIKKQSVQFTLEISQLIKLNRLSFGLNIIHCFLLFTMLTVDCCFINI